LRSDLSERDLDAGGIDVGAPDFVDEIAGQSGRGRL
jgi:hypothetical protein